MRMMWKEGSGRGERREGDNSYMLGHGTLVMRPTTLAWRGSGHAWEYLWINNRVNQGSLLYPSKCYLSSITGAQPTVTKQGAHRLLSHTRGPRSRLLLE